MTKASTSLLFLLLADSLYSAAGAIVRPLLRSDPHVRDGASAHSLIRSSVSRGPSCCTYEALRPPPEMNEELPSELAVTVGPAGDMGQGAFAAESAPAGRWVCEYVGELVTLLETVQRYTDVDPQYLFQITPELYLDAMDSTHFSRFFNHAQHGNLNFTVDPSRRRIDFYLSRDVETGEELRFDCAACKARSLPHSDWPIACAWC